MIAFCVWLASLGGTGGSKVREAACIVQVEKCRSVNKLSRETACYVTETGMLLIFMKDGEFKK